MANLNKVMLIGRLTRDPEQRFISSGTGLVEFGLAVNRTFTANGEKREETTFVDITCWGPAGDTIMRYMKKGESIFVEGRLKFDKWESKEGQPRSKLSVVCDRFQFLGSGGGGNREDGGGDRQAAPQRDSIEPMDFGLGGGGGGGGGAQQDAGGFGGAQQPSDDIPF